MERRPERRLPVNAASVVAWAISAATVASLIWLGAAVRWTAWPAALMIWGAVAWSSLPFVFLARPSPARPAESGASPGVTTIISLGGEPLGDVRAAVLAATRLGSTIVATTDPAALDELNLGDVPVVVGRSTSHAIAAAACDAETEAVLVVSPGAIPDAVHAARAATLLNDPAIGWVVGVSVLFNSDGYGPSVREPLEQSLRGACRAAGAVIWEPDATIVRASLLREPLSDDVPFGEWLRRAARQGWVGVSTSAIVSHSVVPVTAAAFWRREVLRRTEAVADLASAARHSPGRAQTVAMLAREQSGWALGVFLVAPALLSMQGEFPFDAPALLVVAVLAIGGALRWATLRWVHHLPLHPARDVLAAAYSAPASLVASPAACSRSVRPSRVGLPPRPLGWVAAALALLMTAVVITSGTRPTHTIAVAFALTELMLLWWFAIHGSLQLLRRRARLRLRANATALLDGHLADVRDVSPTGISAVLVNSESPPIGATVHVAVVLEDGGRFETSAHVRHHGGSPGTSEEVGLEFVFGDLAAERDWALHLARSVMGFSDGSFPGRTRRRRIGTALLARLVGAMTIGVLTIPVVAIPILSVFGLHASAVVSPSMSPSLRVGDVVIVRTIAAADLAVGDVTTIDVADDGGTTHRVVAVETVDGDVAVSTRGDANLTGERWMLDATEHVGLVEARIPWVGQIVIWLPGRVLHAVVFVGVLATTATAILWALIPKRHQRAGRAKIKTVSNPEILDLDMQVMTRRRSVAATRHPLRSGTKDPRH